MIASLAALLLAAQQAGPTPAEAAMLACASKPEAERLACFDAVSARLSQAALDRMAAPAAPTAPARPPARGMSPDEVAAQAAAAARGVPLRADGAAATTPTGSTVPTTPRPAPRAASVPDGLPADAPIAAIEFGPHDTARITLADGQVWQQLSSDSNKLRVRDRDEAAGMTATIKRAALGSHRMKVEPQGRTIRVRRAD